MKTRLVLRPGQRGTRNLVKKYGESLLCVRFRYDAQLRLRIKTVELVVEKTEWVPPRPQYTKDAFVALRIEASHIPMQSQVKTSGGKWDAGKPLWFVQYGKIVGLHSKSI